MGGRARDRVDPASLRPAARPRRRAVEARGRAARAVGCADGSLAADAAAGRSRFGRAPRDRARGDARGGGRAADRARAGRPGPNSAPGFRAGSTNPDFVRASSGTVVPKFDPARTEARIELRVAGTRLGRGALADRWPRRRLARLAAGGARAHDGASIGSAGPGEAGPARCSSRGSLVAPACPLDRRRGAWVRRRAAGEGLVLVVEPHHQRPLRGRRRGRRIVAAHGGNARATPRGQTERHARSLALSRRPRGPRAPLGRRARLPFRRAGGARLGSDSRFRFRGLARPTR